MALLKVLGIFSFSENIKTIKINDLVIFKKEPYNIKDKNAIGVYSEKNKKIGYLPENQKYDELIKYNYKISKMILTQNNPLIEISRYYPDINYIENIEYPYEKIIKYNSIGKIQPTDELTNSLIKLEKFLFTHNITVNYIDINYIDENYINISIQLFNNIIKFETITMKYFKDNKNKYDELYDYGLINTIFYKDFLVYRLENYIEKNYDSIYKYKKINNINYTLEEIIEHNKIKKFKSINLFILIKLYIKYKLTNNDSLLLLYINDFDNKEFLEDIYKIQDDIINKYKLQLGNLIYNNKLKIYDYIDFVNDDCLFIIGKNFIPNYIYSLNLTKKQYILVYNPYLGKIIKVSNILN